MDRIEDGVHPTRERTGRGRFRKKVSSSLHLSTLTFAMSVCLSAEQIQREASPNYTNLMVMNGDEIICDCEVKNLIGVDIEFCNDDGRSFL